MPSCQHPEQILDYKQLFAQGRSAEHAKGCFQLQHHPSTLKLHDDTAAQNVNVTIPDAINFFCLNWVVVGAALSGEKSLVAAAVAMGGVLSYIRQVLCSAERYHYYHPFRQCQFP